MRRQVSARFVCIGLFVVCVVAQTLTAPGGQTDSVSPLQGAEVTGAPNAIGHVEESSTAQVLAQNTAPEPAARVAEPAPAGDDELAPLTEQSYTGSNRCFTCHRPQVAAWAATPHAEAYNHLPSKYKNDESCLKCHTTGFDQPGGFVAGSEKDLVSVGCETCHGPGALHENAAMRFALSSTEEEEEKLLKEMKATVILTPSDAVCAKCHTETGHGQHPPYDGQPQREIASARRTVHYYSPCCTSSAPSSTSTLTRYHAGYSVKTCGACHYDQYKRWRHDPHAALSAKVPAKYKNDAQCTTCHTQGHGVSKVVMAESGPELADNYVNAACESCHGSGREHVKFNLPFIASPPLGPLLEQKSRESIRKDKSDNTCFQCHLGERHKSHVEYTK